MVWPDRIAFILTRQILVRLLIVLILLSAYAWLFESAGFIISTALFCAIFSRLLGASLLQAVSFGAASGLLGHVVCVILLDLNLPEGSLSSII